MKRKLIGLSIAMGFVWLLNLLQVVGFRYPIWQENSCLKHPIKIISFRNEDLILEDGRVLKMDLSVETPEEVTKMLAHSQGLVEIETEIDSTSAVVWINKSVTRCGTPWSALLRIPLFPVKRDGNRRAVLGFAEIQHAPANSRE